MKTTQYVKITGSFNTVGYKLWQQTVYGVHSVCISPHWHEQMELLYIAHGEIDMTVGEEAFRAVPGMVVILNPKQIHSGISASVEVKYYVIQIDLELLQNTANTTRQHIETFAKGKIRFPTVPKNQKAVDAIIHLFDVLHNVPHPLTATGQVYQTLGTLYELCATEQNLLHSSNEKFRQVLEYIDEHYTEPLSAQNISSLFNYSESHFCRLFKQLTGMTLSTYVRILRMEKAQQLLRQPNISIAQVATQCGYPDANYFCLCVRKHFKMSPTELRQKLRGM